MLTHSGLEIPWLTATAGRTLLIYIKGGLSINPVTPTVLLPGFSVFSGAGVFCSSDDGGSWTASLANADVEMLLVHPLTPTLVLAGDRQGGLYRGDDSWQSSSLSASRIT